MLIELIGKGIAFAAPVGPVTAEAIRRGLQGGFNPAFRVKMGAALGDAVLLLIVFKCVAMIQNEYVRSSISLVGAFFIIYMGITNILKGLKTKIDLNSPATFENGFKLGLGLALTNPFAVAFWFGIFADSSSLQSLGTNPLIGGAYILLGVLIWDVILCLILEWGKSYVNVSFIKSTTVVAGFLLFGFGLFYINTSLNNMFGFNSVQIVRSMINTYI